MRRAHAGIVVLTRVPGAGPAKSRLAADVGAVAATRLATAFLLDTLSMCDQAGLPATVHYTPATASVTVAALAPGRALHPQCAGDLGVRIQVAMASGLASFERCILIGSDSPDLGAGTLARAAEALDHHDLVLGPATDGGFTLIAARAPLPPSLFHAVAWSTGTVLAQALRNAGGLGLRVALLPEAADVDDLASLHALEQRLAGTTACPATQAALTEAGLFERVMGHG
jgi:hypothetical protein